MTPNTKDVLLDIAAILGIWVAAGAAIAAVMP